MLHDMKLNILQNMYVDYALTARDGLVIGTEGGYNSPVNPSYNEYMRIYNQGNMLTEGTIEAVKSITGGSITSTRNISTFSGNIQTTQGTITCKAGALQTLGITGQLASTSQTVSGIYDRFFLIMQRLNWLQQMDHI
ncbi:MAG: hypothetical protein ACKPKO_15320 [Candidatus Fonsibacter sp.]